MYVCVVGVGGRADPFPLGGQRGRGGGALIPQGGKGLDPPPYTRNHGQRRAVLVFLKALSASTQI
jgi:hypothetical protein